MKIRRETIEFPCERFTPGTLTLIVELAEFLSDFSTVLKSLLSNGRKKVNLRGSEEEKQNKAQQLTEVPLSLTKQQQRQLQ